MLRPGLQIKLSLIGKYLCGTAVIYNLWTQCPLTASVCSVCRPTVFREACLLCRNAFLDSSLREWPRVCIFQRNLLWLWDACEKKLWEKKCYFNPHTNSLLLESNNITPLGWFSFSSIDFCFIIWFFALACCLLACCHYFLCFIDL